ncbi:SpvB/TcaC N-terminal domain-containing protein [Streptomyces sp. SS]|uniref:SpvB/TcaC N-terminal domain-containing protein n=1 Tax=Streptomyces sp. SS TaxID=260742 RepID=UPI000315CB4F|nr:SpvB/TcaC N-terminal domain-containing protein [Streptomyces sp. SS]
MAPPAVGLPKGGGAIKGIGEKFAADPVTGAGALTVPVAATKGRSGYGPDPVLGYGSGAGNGPFGLGWSLGLPAITRRTDKGVPRYDDAADSDVFILAGAEDLVPVLVPDGDGWVPEALPPRTFGDTRYAVRRYRPRVEGLFARVERWTNVQDPTDVFWRSISRDDVTTWYGRTPESRIADPADASRVFGWLICESHDDRGNLVAYGYKPEDDEGVDTAAGHERHRQRAANRYLRRIRYGNRTPWPSSLDAATGPRPLPGADQWHFELVFDYGEHDTAAPTPRDAGAWAARPDPFSSFRAGFEVRTHRLCRRVLMFHHFPEEPEVGAGCLVRSTDFRYAYGVHTTLAAVTHRGYQREDGGYRARSLPPVEFGYSEAVVDHTVRELDEESLDGLPAGLDGTRSQWVDLDGEGLPGILTEQGGGWFYKRNLSPLAVGRDADTTRTAPPTRARFGPAEAVTDRPSLALATGARFLDLAGDGRPDLVRLTGPDPGFQERAADGEWQPYTPFVSLPDRDWNDPNLRFVDLDGDGLADVLVTEDDALVWHASLGEDGFGPERRERRPRDEERGPVLVFADAEQSVHLADMSGDGLTDLVRIRNGEVCYWPNLGHGRFGPKIVMAGGPRDHPDRFDQGRVLLADVDGSGTTDLLHLHPDGPRIHLNRSGNDFAPPVPLPTLPPADSLTDVLALDLLGNGTACLVWSSSLPADGRRPLRYLDLMGGAKPHLLTRVRNNLGAETEIAYAPSTAFALRDRRAGTPWATGLPFPVHVVERTTTRDKWRGTAFTSRYSYHHGCFDGTEREFRGFARVERTDVEDYGTFAAAHADSPYVTADHRLHQPPVRTVTWHHTGVPVDGREPLHPFRHEYFRAAETYAPPGPDLGGLTADSGERREAVRAFHGALLREETYEIDVSAATDGDRPPTRAPAPVRLVTATTHTLRIRLLQPRSGRHHAVFHTFASETVAHHYELDLRATESAPAPEPDPRIVHTLNVTVDLYGNVLQSVSVAYPRTRPAALADPLLPPGTETLVAAVQAELHAVYTESRTTDPLPPDADRHRLPLPCETRTYELTGVGPAQAGDGRWVTLDGLRRFRLGERHQTGGTPVAELDHHRLPDRTTPQKRLLELVRTLFLDETLAAPLPLGGLTARALPYGTYTLAWTDAMLTTVLGDKATPEVRAAAADRAVSGHLGGPAAVRLLGEDAAGRYWRCSGAAEYDPDAPGRFFLPARWTDPFGNPTRLEHDRYGLSLKATTDPLGNRGEVLVHDYRVMAPRRVRDINGNHAEVRFDALGLPAAVARGGKDGTGDHLTGLDTAALNPELPVLTAFFATDAYDPARARPLLLGASSRWLFHFGEELRDGETVWARHPPCTAVLTRERHAHEQTETSLQAAFLYADGLGGPLVRKVQAEPAEPGGPLRWVADGKTVVNNKGNPVKRYEPYFSPPESGHRFEEPGEHGVTPLHFYDAIGRLIRTDLPDGSHHRVDFSPWHVTDHDRNDTVLEAGNGWYARTSTSALPAERRAARQAAAHAGTPGRALLDGLGHTVVTIAHNRVDGVDEKHVTFTRRDGEGTPLWIQDPRGIRVLQHAVPPLPPGVHPLDDPGNLAPSGFSPGYDLTGRALFEYGPDSGARWALRDAADALLFTWNARGIRTRATYDALRRPVGTYVTATGDTTVSGAPRDPAAPPAPEALLEHRVYGEQHPDPDRNLRGRAYRVYDGAGVTTSERYDFKGNLLATARRFGRDHTGTPDWSPLGSLTDPDRIAEAAEPLLEPGPPLTTGTAYDALDRPVETTAPDGSVTRSAYNEAGLPERVEVRLRGAAAATAFVTDVDYDAHGRRTRVAHGNGARSTYTYDPFTFRVTGVRTTRPADPDSTASLLFANASVVQDLHYTYDPVGNITRIEDASLATIAGVGTARDFTHDALYRLVAASGREHTGQTAFLPDPPDAGQRDHPFAGARVHPNDLQGLRGYVERYRYDAVGNLMHLAHHEGTDVEAPGPTLWRRHHQYALDGNRLLATSLPGETGGLPDYAAEGGYGARYVHDAHGNTTRMPHLPLMRWDHGDRLAATARQVVNDGTPETTHYVYDSAGERVRKLTVTAAGALKNERRYVGGFELYREYGTGGTVLERETLHIDDAGERLALVETATLPAGPAAVRYRFADHQDSVCVELDERGALVGHEEYHPYGTTAFQSGRTAAETGLKRYRHTAKERDDETGLGYFGARYYAPWIGRWTSCDPAGLADGPCRYAYARCGPVRYRDPDGRLVDEGGKFAAAAAAAAAAFRAGRPAIAAAPSPQAKAVVAVLVGVVALGVGLSMLGDRKPSAPGTPAPAPPVTPPGPPPPPAPPPPKRDIQVPRTAPDPDVERIHGQVVGGTFVPAVPRDTKGGKPATSTGGGDKRTGPGTEERTGAGREAAPQPSNRWLEQCRRDKKKRQEVDDDAVRTYLDTGGRIQVIKDKTEKHHVATNKDQEFRPQFEEMFDNASVPGLPALTLNSPENIVTVEGHQGPHGPDYHKAVLKRLQDAVAGKATCTPEYRAALTEALRLLKKDLQRKGSELNDLVTRK